MKVIKLPFEIIWAEKKAPTVTKEVKLADTVDSVGSVESVVDPPASMAEVGAAPVFLAKSQNQLNQSE